MRHGRLACTLFAALAAFLAQGVFPGRAFAYLDPGTGSYMFQLLIATVIGALFALKVYWGKVALFFKKIFAGKR